MDVRIYSPAKTATQSGRAKTHRWVLEFESTAPREVDDLMGWTGSRDTQAQVRLDFGSKEEAVAYAEKHGHSFTIEEPHQRRVAPKSYADNFLRRP